MATVPGGGQRERSGLGDQEIKAESENNWNVSNLNRNSENYFILSLDISGLC